MTAEEEEACKIVDGWANGVYRVDANDKAIAKALRQALAEAQATIGYFMAEYQDEDGMTILRQEYEALEAERDALRRKLDAAMKALTGFNYPADGSIDDLRSLALAALEARPDMTEPPPLHIEALAAEIQQGVGSGNFGRAAIALRLRECVDYGVQAERARIIAELREPDPRLVESVAICLGIGTGMAKALLPKLADHMEHQTATGGRID